jgi:hypothetical protein
MLIESKSLLAKLMATENLTVEVRNVPTAFFDMKNRVLVMPALKEGLSSNLLDLFGGHEVGHALFTPMEGWHDSVVDLKVNRSILNVCEDARIEKKIKRKYPGLRNSFTKAYRELMEQDFFGLRGAHPNTLNFIDRVNLHTKGGASQGIKFNDEESQLLSSVENAETFDETIAAALDIQKYMKQKNDEIKIQTEKEKELRKAEGDEEGDEYDMLEDGSSDDMSNDYSGVDESDEGKPANRKGSGNADDGSNDEDVVQSHTDNHFRNKEKELFQSGVDYTHVTLPEIDLEKVIVSYTHLHNEIINTNQRYGVEIDYDFLNKEYSKFRTESNKVVSYLVKEFEMRKNAEQLKRASIAKTGELNLSKLYSYGFAEDLFKRITVTPGGKSHGLVMFIDWSGSMHSNMRNTIKQLLNLVMFCRKVNIPYEVYAFSNNCGVPDLVKEYKEGNLVVKNFQMLNILSSKMNASEFTRAAKFLLGMFCKENFKAYTRSSVIFFVPDVFQLSSTPLNEAIIAGKQIINKFRKDYRLQVVNTVFLTDGEGHSLYSYYTTKRKEGYDPHKYFHGGSKSRMIIRDTDTKASVVINDLPREQTPALLKLLKESTGANVIGFYIIDSREVRRALCLYTPEGTNTEAMVSQFKKEKTLTIKSAGYDEYYLLNSNKMDIDEDTEFEVKSTSTRSLVSAFGKYTSNRVHNRTVLNKFINLIT